MLAAYGTLRVGQPNWWGLLTDSKFRGTHRLPGFAMHDNMGLPVAVRERSSFIMIDLFDIEESCLQNFDRLEGHPDFYHREKVVVGNTDAWIYTFNDSDGPSIVHGDWTRYLEENCKIHQDRCLYFAYGSNMNRAQIKKRCPGSAFVDIGILQDFSFQLTERGTATVVPDDGHFVMGAILDISLQDKACLDRKEGVANEIYYRHLAPIVNGRTGETIIASVYTATAKIAADICRPGYGKVIIEGAVEIGLSAEYLKILYRVLRKDMEVQL